MTVCIWMMEKNSNILDLRILKRKNFFKELLIAINLLMNKLNDKYIIDDNMDFLKKIIIKLELCIQINKLTFSLQFDSITWYTLV